MQKEASLWACAAKGILDCPPYWLSLFGRSGTGKTMLAKAARRFAEKGQFWKWTSILNLLRQGEWQLKDHLFRLPLLVVDDVNAGHETSFSYAFLEELADARLGKWTLFTANCSLEQIGDQVSERVRSRMRRDSGRVVEIFRSKSYDG